MVLRSWGVQSITDNIFPILRSYLSFYHALFKFMLSKNYNSHMTFLTKYMIPFLPFLITCIPFLIHWEPFLILCTLCRSQVYHSWSNVNHSWSRLQCTPFLVMCKQFLFLIFSTEAEYGWVRFCWKIIFQFLGTSWIKESNFCIQLNQAKNFMEWKTVKKLPCCSWAQVTYT